MVTSNCNKLWWSNSQLEIISFFFFFFLGGGDQLPNVSPISLPTGAKIYYLLVLCLCLRTLNIHMVHLPTCYRTPISLQPFLISLTCMVRNIKIMRNYQRLNFGFRICGRVGCIKLTNHKKANRIRTCSFTSHCFKTQFNFREEPMISHK